MERYNCIFTGNSMDGKRMSEDEINKLLRQYNRLFETITYLDFKKKWVELYLEGNIKNQKYKISINWDGKYLRVGCARYHSENGGYWEDMFGKNNANGGSEAQMLSSLFYELKIPVPKNLNGDLDLNLMIDTLIKKYKFKKV